MTIKDSEDLLAKGHGFKCVGCKSIELKNSIFYNLRAGTATAVLIEEEMSSESIISNCTFESNLAVRSSASIRLKNAGKVYIKDSYFTKN